MAFWGVEVTPNRRHLHRFDPTLGRLHISQATLGNGSSQNKSVLQCNVGNKAPILLCCLMPEKVESCCLNLEFEEDDSVDVIFSVVGPRSVHLAGYYLPHHRDDDETDSHGEDVGDTDTDKSNDNDSEDEYEPDFIDDSELIPTYSPSPRPKRLKKKYQLVISTDSDSDSDHILGGSTSIFDSHSDTDTDQHSLSKKKSHKRKSQHSPQSGIEVPNESSLPSSEVGIEISEKRKKKKKKEHTKEEKTPRVGDLNMIDLHIEDKAQKKVEEPVSDERHSNDKEFEKANGSCCLSSAEHGPKKKGKKKRINEGNTQGGGTDDVHIDDKAQMQEAQAIHITNDDHVIGAVAASGGKKKKKKNKKKAGDEPASEEEPRKETDKGGIGGRKKQKRI